MVKTILKEVIITTLLWILILLILSVLFYDYNPITKVVPNKIAYTAPEEIKEELKEESIVDDTINIQNKIYKVEGSDLNLYKKGNSYNPSKQNPFASSTSQTVNATTQKNVVDGIEKKTNVSNASTTSNTTPSNRNTGLK